MSVKVKFDGLKKLKKNLQNLKNVQRVSFPELFNEGFMQKHTNYQTIEAMFTASGFKVESQEDFTAISDTEWDFFIQKSTHFSSWEEMQKTAAGEFAAKKLGL